MSSTLMPFLYQTRTIQRSPFWRRCARTGAKQVALSSTSSRWGRKNASRDDDTIPFDFEHEASPQKSTITPSEADIFKGIFDEIASGKMTKSPVRWKSKLSASPQGDVPRPESPHRIAAFREHLLERYPESLRSTAQVALGLYGKQDASSMLLLDESDDSRFAEVASKNQQRKQEFARLEKMMRAAPTDLKLWQLLEKEVFVLPTKLGLVGGEDKKKKKKTTAKAEEADQAEGATSTAENQDAASQNVSMDIHGPLYPQLITLALGLLQHTFGRPSPLLFRLLPRVKSLGLPSYVLGISSTFYSRLAAAHWDLYGDAERACDVLNEAELNGLHADSEAAALVARMQRELVAIKDGWIGDQAPDAVVAPDEEQKEGGKPAKPDAESRAKGKFKTKAPVKMDDAFARAVARIHCGTEASGAVVWDKLEATMEMVQTSLENRIRWFGQ